MTKKEQGARADIYARITDRIIADLEKGVRPWVQPWNVANANGRISRPLRHNGEPYTGMNTLLLWSEGIERGFASPMWMTFRQAVQLNASVRKGENGATVVFASRFTKSEANGNGGDVEREIPFLKAYTVFNVAQIDGLPDDYYHRPEPVIDPVERIEHAERFLDNTGAVVRYGGDKAFFHPPTDHIQLPPREVFRDSASLIAIRGHETLHWTSASHRLNRDLSRYHKDRRERAMEEVLVELGSCFLCADLGIVPELEPRPDHASYIQSWISLLGSDKRAIFQAAAHAQRAVNYLHCLQPHTDADETREAA